MAYMVPKGFSPDEKTLREVTSEEFSEALENLEHKPITTLTFGYYFTLKVWQLYNQNKNVSEIQHELKCGWNTVHKRINDRCFVDKVVDLLKQYSSRFRERLKALEKEHNDDVTKTKGFRWFNAENGTNCNAGPKNTELSYGLKKDSNVSEINQSELEVARPKFQFLFPMLQNPSIRKAGELVAKKPIVVPVRHPISIDIFPEYKAPMITKKVLDELSGMLVDVTVPLGADDEDDPPNIKSALLIPWPDDIEDSLADDEHIRQLEEDNWKLLDEEPTYPKTYENPAPPEVLIDESVAEPVGDTSNEIKIVSVFSVPTVQSESDCQPRKPRVSRLPSRKRKRSGSPENYSDFSWSSRSSSYSAASPSSPLVVLEGKGASQPEKESLETSFEVEYQISTEIKIEHFPDDGVTDNTSESELPESESQLLLSPGLPVCAEYEQTNQEQPSEPEMTPFVSPSPSATSVPEYQHEEVTPPPPSRNLPMVLKRSSRIQQQDTQISFKNGVIQKIPKIPTNLDDEKPCVSAAFASELRPRSADVQLKTKNASQTRSTGRESHKATPTVKLTMTSDKRKRSSSRSKRRVVRSGTTSKNKRQKVTRMAPLTNRNDLDEDEEEAEESSQDDADDDFVPSEDESPEFEPIDCPKSYSDFSWSSRSSSYSVGSPCSPLVVIEGKGASQPEQVNPETSIEEENQISTEIKIEEEFTNLRETLEESMAQILSVKQKLSARKEILQEENAKMDEMESQLRRRKESLNAASEAAEKEFNRVKAQEEDWKKKSAELQVRLETEKQARDLELREREEVIKLEEAEVKARNLKLKEREELVKLEEVELKARDSKLAQRTELVKVVAEKLEKENDILRIQETEQGEMAKRFELRAAALEMKLAELKYKEILIQQVENAAKKKMELLKRVEELQDSLELESILQQGDKST